MNNNDKYSGFTLKLFLSLIILTQYFYAQNFEYKYSVKGLRNATSFAMSLDNSYLVLSEANNYLIKINPSGKVLKEIKGFGWGEYTFDSPVDVEYNILKVFVADRNNHRIKIFNRKLDFIKNLQGETEDEYYFSYPSRCKVSATGNIFILETENNQLLKFDPEGKFLQNVTDFSKADFALENPNDFSFDDAGNIYVLDENKVMVFDEYGTGLRTIPVPANLNSICRMNNNLLLNNEKEIFFMSIDLAEIKKLDIFFPVEHKSIRELEFNGSLLHILTEDKILVFENFEVKTK